MKHWKEQDREDRLRRQDIGDDYRTGTLEYYAKCRNCLRIMNLRLCLSHKRLVVFGSRVTSIEESVFSPKKESFKASARSAPFFREKTLSSIEALRAKHNFSFILNPIQGANPFALILHIMPPKAILDILFPAAEPTQTPTRPKPQNPFALIMWLSSELLRLCFTKMGM